MSCLGTVSRVAMTLKSQGVAVAAFFAASLAVASAHAVTITASGQWGANAPTTPYSVAGQTYSFSFVIPKVFSTIYSQPDLSVTTDSTNLKYYLNGSLVPATLDNVTFFNAADGGGLALGFSDFSMDIYGPAFGPGGSAPPPLMTGSYNFFPNINGVPDSPGGTLNEGGATPGVASVVPEPSTWALMLVGFAALGGALRASRRRPATA